MKVMPRLYWKKLKLCKLGELLAVRPELVEGLSQVFLETLKLASYVR